MGKSFRVVLAILIVLGSVVFLEATANAASAKCETSGSTTKCYEIKSTSKSSFDVLATDGVVNTTSRAADITCEISETVTYSAQVTISVSGSIKVWLVGKMDTQVSAEVGSSATATKGSHIEITVPAHTTTYCDRGTYKYVGTGQLTGADGQHTLPTSSFKVTAPSEVVWRFRDQ